jgi:hypothetical protein
MICASGLILLFAGHSVAHPGDKALYAVASFTLLFASVPLLNKWGFVNAGRMFVSIGLVVGSLVFTLTRKLADPEIATVITYYMPRTAIVVFCILPLAVFHISERARLFSSLAIGLLCLLLFDPAHNAW